MSGFLKALSALMTERKQASRTLPPDPKVQSSAHHLVGWAVNMQYFCGTSFSMILTV
jgi:hypothetical protein